jgi:hypothetical protein
MNEYEQIYRDKYLKYKQKYINLKNNLKGGACEKCPIWGFQQHIGECWHDSLSTIMLFSDGICDIIQQIFKNDIETIITQINKNIDENKIPNYYLPFNIEPSDKDFFKNEVNEYVRQLYFRYHNESKEVALLDTLKADIKKYPFFRQPSLDCSLDSIENIFNIVNINNNKPTKYLKDIHGGSTIHDLTVLSVINYCFMNYNRYANLNENKYITSFYLDLSYNRLLVANFNKKAKEILENYIKYIEYIISLLDTDILCIAISLINRTTREGHAQAFIKCNGKLYFYDNNGIEKIDYKFNTTLVEFNWKEYLKTKFLIIIQRIKDELLTIELDKLDINTFYEKFLDITKVVSGFLIGHGDDVTFGYKMLENMYVDNLIFFKIENEQNDITNEQNKLEYYKKFDQYLYDGTFFTYNNNKIINHILSNINFNENCIYFDKIINNNNYKLMYEMFLKYENSVNIIINYYYYNSLIMHFLQNINESQIEDLLKISKYLILHDLQNINEKNKYFIDKYFIIKSNLKILNTRLIKNIKLKDIINTQKTQENINIHELQRSILLEIIKFILEQKEYKINEPVEPYLENFETLYDLMKDKNILELIDLFETNSRFNKDLINENKDKLKLKKEAQIIP